MKNIPQYFMDSESFYMNPEHPDNHLRIPPEATAEDIKKIRIPVNIFRDGKYVDPNGVLPQDIKDTTLVLV